MLLNIRPIVRFPRRTSQGSSALTALPGHTTTRPTPTPINGYQGEEVAWKMFAKSGTSFTQSWRRCENPSSMDSMSQGSLSLEQSETRKAWTISFFSMHCANHSTRQSKISQSNQSCASCCPALFHAGRHVRMCHVAVTVSSHSCHV